MAKCICKAYENGTHTVDCPAHDPTACPACLQMNEAAKALFSLTEKAVND